jgi:hypothetical protein
MTDLGKIAYEAYFTACTGKSLITKQQLPSWDGQSNEIKAAWLAVGIAVHKASKIE